MKIRTSFVSNSSSSSYIIAVRKDSRDVCPHCGRGGHDIISFLDDHYSRSYDDTQINHTNAKGIIKELEEDITDEKNSIVSSQFLISQLKKSGKESETKQFFKNIDLSKDSIDQYERLIKKIKEYENKEYLIYGISISYHDNVLNQIFLESKNSGNIVVLDED